MIQKIFVSQLSNKQQVETLFMFKSMTVKSDKNDRKYLDILMADATGEIIAKAWSVSEKQIEETSKLKAGDIIKVKGSVTVFNGSNQLNVSGMALASGDEYDANDFFKKAPEDSEEMWQYIYDRAEQIKDEDFRRLTVKLMTENKDRLLYYPAAQRNHHAEYGGLLYHMKRMLMNGDGMCRVYTNLDSDLLATGVIIHDMEKLNEINSNNLGVSDGYSFEGRLLGHIIMGIRRLGQLAEELNMPKQKEVMLEHMVLSHHYEPDFGSPKKPLFPEAEILHYLDMIDAKMFDMEDALHQVAPGDFSDRIWTLDGRCLYRRKEEE